MVEDLVVSVGLADIVGYHGIVARTWGGREAEVEPRVVDLVDLYALDFGELFHAALDLHGLGGLVAETLYERLSVGNLLLLVEVCAHLLFDTFLAQLDKFGIVDRIVIYLAA